MRAVLADTVAGLALAGVLLIALIIAARARTVRRRRQQARLRPPAERLLAEFLVGSPRVPPMAGQDERTALRHAALEALADLRGSEHARLVEFLEQLGCTRQAISELAARRRAVRRRAAETLAAIASPSAVPALTAALADRDVLVRTTCARIIADWDIHLIGVESVAAAEVRRSSMAGSLRGGPSSARVPSRALPGPGAASWRRGGPGT